MEFKLEPAYCIPVHQAIYRQKTGPGMITGVYIATPEKCAEEYARMGKCNDQIKIMECLGI